MLISVVLSAFLALSSPQADALSYWDRVLECYERLCDACIGNEDSKTIALIKGDLDLLLKNPTGKMNEEQQRRFDEIRSRHSGVSIASPDGGRIDTIVIVKQIPVEKIREIDHVVVYDTVRVNNNINTIVVEHQYSRRDTTIIIHTLRGEGQTDGTTGSSFPLFAGVSFGVTPDFSAGVIVGAGRKAGFYIKGRSNFRSVSANYSIEDVGDKGFWGSGSSASTRNVICGGGWFTLFKGLRLYAGAGYGESLFYVQDLSNSWVRVNSACISSVALDLGLMYNFGWLTLLGGVNTTAFKYTDVELGVAVSFGK